MGIVAIPFAVDLAKVKGVFGSKDRELLEKIKTANLYKHYSRVVNDLNKTHHRNNFDQALEDIIFNYIKPEGGKRTSGLNEDMAYFYGYALIVVCDYLGTHLLLECDAFCYGSEFKEAASIMKKKGLQLDLVDMFNQHHVFDIPENSDFPGIKLFTKDEIEHVNQVMDKIEIDESKIDFDSEDFDEVQQLLSHIRESFRMCKEQNVEMVTFAH